MKLEPVYAIVDSAGRPEMEVDGDLEETVEAALGEYGRHTPIVFNGDLEQLKKEGAHRRTVQSVRADNPPATDAAMMALGPSFARDGRPRVLGLDEVFRMFPDDREGLKAAHAALRPFFPQKGEVKVQSAERGTTGVVGGTYDTPAGMSGALLVANAKTSKAEEGLAIGETGGGATIIEDESIPPSLSKGLAFLPHALAKTEQDFPMLGGLPMLRSTVGVCVGSSEECRKSCLVYAGQNQAVAHNNVVKGMRLRALLERPEAFTRMMIDSIRKHIETSKRAGVVPYFRPNILSDIPWEIFFPDLWNVFPDLRVYDYTKLPGRETEFLGRHRDGILRYDLTFSFSGTNANYMERELARGMRLAIVFLRGLKAGAKGRKGYRAPESFADLRFLGHKVIDGDTHDLRPLDPQGTVVGLRFKSLSGKSAGSRGEQIEKAGRFVVGAKGSRAVPRGKGQRIEPGLVGYEEGGRTVIHREGGSLVGTALQNTKYVVEAFRTPDGDLITAGTPFQQGVSESSLYGAGAQS